MAKSESAAAVLKRLMVENRLTYAKVTEQTGISSRKLSRMLKGVVAIRIEDAESIGRLLPVAGRNAFLDAVRTSPEKLPVATSAKAFGEFVAAMRRSVDGRTAAKMEAASGLKQSNLAAIESGKSVPNPKAAARLAVALGLSAQDSAWMFKLLGAALREHGTLSKATECPELLALTEWLIQQNGLADKQIVVAEGLSALPDIDDAKVRSWCTVACELLSQLAAGAKPGCIPYACVHGSQQCGYIILPLVLPL